MRKTCPMDVAVLEVLFRGIAVGAFAAMACGFWRGARDRPVRIAGVLFMACTSAYALNSCLALTPALGWFIWPVHVLALGGGAAFWLFIVTLFEDRPITPLTLAPLAVMTVIGLLAIATHPPLRGALWITHNILQTVLAVAALIVVVRSWRGDLVEARRRLRGPLLIATGLFTVAISAVQIGQRFGFNTWWFDLASGVALALLASAGAAIFLRSNDQIFGAARPAHEPDPLSPADRAALAKLETAMNQGEAWRREGLTIGALAEEVGVPEHRLRRLINDHLGERNFAAFVNARRIAAAKAILSDPSRAQDSVSAVAFNLGFASLGPFNRAFKEATGLTPSEWRRQGSPNLEKPR